MTGWQQSLNRELRDLNDAHSATRIDTLEYRRRRRALLNSILRQESIASHTLRRPVDSAGARAGKLTTIRTLASHRPAGKPPGSSHLLWWCLGAAVLCGAVVACLKIWSP